jgi:uncharacterized protein (DUF433 family)
MSARPIVRKSDVLDGRWHFESTTIGVADVVADYMASRDGFSSETYVYAGLSQDEIAAALEFKFPATRETTVQVEYASLTVHCECGEDTPATGVWPMVAEVECPCRRRWRITIEPAPALA